MITRRKFLRGLAIGLPATVAVVAVAPLLPKLASEPMRGGVFTVDRKGWRCMYQAASRHLQMWGEV